jgi:hypothetical protein
MPMRKKEFKIKEEIRKDITNKAGKIWRWKGLVAR